MAPKLYYKSLIGEFSKNVEEITDQVNSLA